MFGSTVNVKLARGLYERAAKAAERDGYSSADEFIVHVVERAVDAIKNDQSRQEVDKQLRGLGYLE